MSSYKPPILLLAAIAALPPLAVDMYLPAMPGIAEDINTSISLVQNSLSIFLVGFGLGMLCFGPLSDRYGRRPLASFGLIGFAVTSWLIASSHSGSDFLTFRFLQGLLGSAASVVVPAIVRDTYGKQTARGMSSVMMIMLVAPLVAPLLGSLLLTIAPWELIFHAQATYALLLLGLTIWLLEETRPAEAAATDRSLLGSVLANYRLIFGHRAARYDLLTSLFTAVSFFTYLTAVSFIYITWFGVSETLFGVLFAVTAASLIVANYVNIRWVGRIGTRRMLHLGLALALSLSLVLVLSLLAGAGVYVVVGCFVLIIGGLGLCSVNADSLVLVEFPQAASSASAVIGTLRFGSGALAGPILAWAYTGTPVPAALLIVTGITLGVLIQWLRHRLSPAEANAH